MKIKNPRSFKQHKEDKESIIQQLLEEMIETTTVLENLEIEKTVKNAKVDR